MIILPTQTLLPMPSPPERMPLYKASILTASKNHPNDVQNNTSSKTHLLSVCYGMIFIDGPAVRINWSSIIGHRSPATRVSRKSSLFELLSDRERNPILGEVESDPVYLNGKPQHLLRGATTRLRCWLAPNAEGCRRFTPDPRSSCL